MKTYFLLSYVSWRLAVVIQVQVLAHNRPSLLASLFDVGLVYPLSPITNIFIINAESCVGIVSKCLFLNWCDGVW